MAAKRAFCILRIAYPDGIERDIQVQGSPFNIGREPGNDLQLPDRNISRQHARLIFEAERIQLIDLKSSNGTMLGEIRLPPNEPFEIQYQQEFRIGPYRVWLEASPEPTTEAKQPPAEGAPDAKAEPALPEEPKPKEEMPVRAHETPRAAAKAPAKRRPRRPGAPPPPPPPSKEAGVGWSSYDRSLGIPKDQSRYLEHLPPVFSENAFLGQFLLAFEGILAPIEQTVDHFDMYLDPNTAGEGHLGRLASWLGLTLDEKWPSDKQRAVIAEAAELYQRRGTRAGLSRLIEIYGEVSPEITEPKDTPHHFEVKLRLAKKSEVDQKSLARIIEANKPAHTTYTLEIVSE
jgi:phage tail-like protein